MEDPVTPEPTRYCPLCDSPTDAEVCDAHGVPTVPLARLDTSDVLVEGTTLHGRYVVEAPLGHGGMGAVYRGRQLPFGRPVALKTLLPRLAGSSHHLRRFYKEADALHRLTHPNVVRVFDFGLDEPTGVAFLAMELVDGEPLDSRFGAHGLPERAAAGLLAQVASALAEVHAAGVVHRDLKPANVLVTRLSDGDDAVKVVDFGLARTADDAAGTGQTTAGYVVGTPGYISPEQIAQGAIDHRADAYALGCMLFHALTGAPPFRGEAMVVLSQHLGTPAPELPARLADGAAPSDAMRALVRDLLAKRPAERPGTLGEVARRLKALAAFGSAEVPVAPAAPVGTPPVASAPVGETLRARPLAVVPAPDLDATLDRGARLRAPAAIPPPAEVERRPRSRIPSRPTSSRTSRPRRPRRAGSAAGSSAPSRPSRSPRGQRSRSGRAAGRPRRAGPRCRRSRRRPVHRSRARSAGRPGRARGRSRARRRGAGAAPTEAATLTDAAPSARRRRPTRPRATAGRPGSPRARRRRRRRGRTRRRRRSRAGTR
ncbi:MAG: serine/threonine protein kinase [Deltaproteobacteria bacterium]|nr:serine/threonine protein kinase [Deltaproteobacteria bacterium]